MSQNNYLSNLLSQSKPLSHERQKELVRDWQSNQNKQSLDELTLSNLRIVSRDAWKISSTNIASSYEDLMQEGVAGLLKAAEMYDEGRGTNFLSYAMMWSNAYMKRHMMDRRCIVKLATTRDSRAIFSGVSRARIKAEREGCEGDAKTKRMAEILNVKLESLTEMLGVLSGHDSSLSSLIGDENSGATMQDLMPDDNSLVDAVEKADGDLKMKSALSVAFKSLTEQEREIVFERYFSGDKKTLRDLSKELNISREWARQVEIRALDKIRKTLGRDFGIRSIDNY